MTESESAQPTAAAQPVRAVPGPEAAERPMEPEQGRDGVAGTGHPAVDGALRALGDSAGSAPADQVPVYQAAHRVLRETLESIDQG